MVKNQSDSSYIFKVTMAPDIWRKIQIPSHLSLDALHRAILQSFGFENDHLYAFFMDGKVWSRQSAYWSEYAENSPKAKNKKLSSFGFEKNDKFLYLLDFGDEWRFKVSFVKEVESSGQTKPLVINSKGGSPEQYPDYDDDEDFEDNELFTETFISANKRDTIHYKIIKGDGDPSIKDAYYIRDEVFTKEQGYPADIDIDEYDKIAWHCIMYDDHVPIGTARLIPQEGTGKIGRVAILRNFRGIGLGHDLMEALMKEASKQGLNKLALSAQVYAIEFYEKLGFTVSGEQYLEDGEPHIYMTTFLD